MILRIAIGGSWLRKSQIGCVRGIMATYQRRLQCVPHQHC